MGGAAPHPVRGWRYRRFVAAGPDSTLSPSLSDAVERVYTVFAGHPLPPVTAYCTHCVTAAEEAELHRYPLRELPVAVMTGFAADSLMTWGDLPDVKHLLPRMLELVATAAYGGFPDVETIVGVLARGKWTTWPADEQAAVRGFLHAWWADELARWPSRHGIESVLSAVAVAEDDLAPYLAVWEAAADPAAVLHVADLVAGNAARLTAGKPLGNPWLVERPAQNAQATAWLRGHFAAFRPRLAADHGMPEARDVLVTALIVVDA